MAAGEGPAFAVLDSKGRLQGILTEHDLVTLIHQSGEIESDTAVAGGLPTYLGMSPAQLRDLSVSEIMTNDPEAVSPEASVEEIARAMFRNLRKVLLVADHGQLLGQICRSDMIRKVLG
jgi:CBS domain-containing protein